MALFLFVSALSQAYSEEPEGLIPRLLKKWFPAVNKPGTVSQVPAAKGQVQDKLSPEASSEMQKAMAKLPEKVTAEQMRLDIVEALESEDELFVAMPELKKQQEADNKYYYTVRIGERDVKLDELDEAELDNILNKIYGQQASINWQRLNIPQSVIRQTQGVARNQPPKLPPRLPDLPPPPPRKPQDR